MEIEKLFKNGEFEKVVRILEGKRLSPDGYVILGISYYNLGKRNKAISNFKRALSLDPNNVDSLFNLAEMFHQMKKYPKAKEYALRLVKLTPTDWTVHDILSAAYEFEGFFDKALHHLEKSIEYAPKEVLPQLKDKLSEMKSEIIKAKSRKKLAIICMKGLDNFIDDLIEGLQSDYWVQRWAVTSRNEIESAIDWADIVWLEWANDVAILGTRYPPIREKPTLVRLHSYEVFTNMPANVNWKAVDTLVFVAPHIREILFERFPRLKELIKRTRIVLNGVNLKKIPFRSRRPGYGVAWVGHINYKKAPELAIQIIKKLVDIDPRYNLHFAGDFQDPRYEVYLKHIVKSLKIEKNVMFHGWVDDMDEFWEDKSYLLSTSLHESFGYAIAEAMARGIKPVVHWFRGADYLYDENWLFKDIDTAVKLITEKTYDSESYRSYLVSSNMTLEDQVENFKEVLEELSLVK